MRVKVITEEKEKVRKIFERVSEEFEKGLKEMSQQKGFPIPLVPRIEEDEESISWVVDWEMPRIIAIFNKRRIIGGLKKNLERNQIKYKSIEFYRD